MRIDIHIYCLTMKFMQISCMISVLYTMNSLILNPLILRRPIATILMQYHFTIKIWNSYYLKCMPYLERKMKFITVVVIKLPQLYAAVASCWQYSSVRLLPMLEMSYNQINQWYLNKKYKNVKQNIYVKILNSLAVQYKFKKGNIKNPLIFKNKIKFNLI